MSFDELCLAKWHLMTEAEQCRFRQELEKRAKGAVAAPLLSAILGLLHPKEVYECYHGTMEGYNGFDAEQRQLPAVQDDGGVRPVRE